MNLRVWSASVVALAMVLSASGEEILCKSGAGQWNDGSARPTAKALQEPRPSVEGPARVAPYYGNAEAAFLLAFDDACVSHLEKAIPLLEKYRVPGTFYLITEAGQFKWKKADWAKAAKSPFVFLGNHTSTHKGVAAPAELGGQVDAANRVIRELTPQEPWPRLVSFAISGGVPWKIGKKDMTEVLSAYDLVERPNFQGAPVALRQNR